MFLDIELSVFITTAGEVTTSALINYEGVPATSFAFTVTVSDPVSSDANTLTIDVINENEAPVFSPDSYSITTTEGTVWWLTILNVQ